jgi:hypothetical protein
MDMVNNPATSKAATAEWTPAAPISEMHQLFLRGDSEKRIGADCVLVNGHDNPVF